jgi:hypothetical protein
MICDARTVSILLQIKSTLRLAMLSVRYWLGLEDIDLRGLVTMTALIATAEFRFYPQVRSFTFSYSLNSMSNC